MNDAARHLGGALQMRLVVEATDYEEAVRFFRDVLGLPEELAVSGPTARR
jgi:hypothetical protein